MDIKVYRVTGAIRRAHRFSTDIRATSRQAALDVALARGAVGLMGNKEPASCQVLVYDAKEIRTRQGTTRRDNVKG